MAPLLIDIPQMIDLALGTPEIGVVNFTVLHSLLHVIAELLNLDTHRVEFRGSQGIKIENLVRNIPAEPIVSCAEFKVEETIEGDHKGLKRTAITKPRSKKIERIIVVRKSQETEEDGKQIVISRELKSIAQPVRVVSQDDFRKLNPKKDSIHDPVGRLMPDNVNLLDPSRRSEDSRNPVGEMWNILNMTKRVDATEVAIEKLTSLMRDISEEYRKTKNTIERISAISDVSNLTEKLDHLEKIMHDKFGKNVHSDRISSVKPPNYAILPSADTHTETEHRDRRKSGGFENQTSEKGHHLHGENHSQSPQTLPKSENLTNFLDLRSEVEKLKEIVQQIFSNSEAAAEVIQHPANLGQSTEQPTSGGSKPSGEIRGLLRRMDLIESKLGTVEHQIFDIEKELTELSDHYEEEARPNSTLKTDVTGVAAIYAQVSSMKTDLELSIDRCNYLIVERDQIVETLDIMTKKMEDFKVSKVDKDEIDELLAEKADYNMLQRKVSVDQFDATKRHLSNGLVEALEKLSEQGMFWERAIEDVRVSVEGKIGREELEPLKEYIDSKLHGVQERLRAMAALRRDPEAAGTRSKFLRQVNCISCDQDVIMRLDEPSIIPRPEPVSAQSTLKPFLVYELDSIRKQMKDPHSRNLHHFEVLTKEKPVLVNGKPKNLANRYCGGSHTVLTPQDKVQRCKFGKKQYPAECFIKSDEGCYYRALKKECECPQNEKMTVLEKPKSTISARSSRSYLDNKQADERFGAEKEDEAMEKDSTLVEKLSAAQISAIDKLSVETEKENVAAKKESSIAKRLSVVLENRNFVTEKRLSGSVENVKKNSTTGKMAAAEENQNSVPENLIEVVDKESSATEKLSDKDSAVIETENAVVDFDQESAVVVRVNSVIEKSISSLKKGSKENSIGEKLSAVIEKENSTGENGSKAFDQQEAVMQIREAGMVVEEVANLEAV